MVSPYGLDAADTLGVVAAENELLHHLGDALDAESAVDDSVFASVLPRHALKVALEQKLQGIDSTWTVYRLGGLGKREGCLSLHSSHKLS